MQDYFHTLPPSFGFQIIHIESEPLRKQDPVDMNLITSRR